MDHEGQQCILMGLESEGAKWDGENQYFIDSPLEINPSPSLRLKWSIDSQSTDKTNHQINCPLYKRNMKGEDDGIIININVPVIDRALSQRRISFLISSG